MVIFKKDNRVTPPHVSETDLMSLNFLIIFVNSKLENECL
jgi:hypothetical protein